MKTLLLSLFALLCAILLSPAEAAAQMTPRAAAHDGFGRMVFDWDKPVQWSADVVNGQLVARFDKPIGGDPKVLLKPLSKYLKGVTVSADKRMATFSLAAPVQIKTFTTGNSTVIDLVEAKNQPAPPPGPAPPATPPAKVSDARTEPATDLMVRGGEHTGFNRLVFDWPKPVGYTVNQDGDKAVIAFDRPANLNVTSLEAALPPDVRFVEAKPQGKGTAIVLSLPPEMRARHFTSGPKVALDLVRAAGTAPTRAAGAQPPPLAPAPGATEQPAAKNGKAEPPKPEAPKPEPVPQPVPQPVKETAKAEPPKPEPAKPEPPKPEPAKQAQTATVTPPAPPPPAPPPPVAAEPAKMQVSLGVPFDQPTGAAAFRRAGWLWLVFDRKTEVDLKLLKRTGGDVVLHVEQVPTVKNTGTALRLITKPGFNPNVRKEGQLWVFDLVEQPVAPKASLAVDRQFDFEDRGRLILPMTDAPAAPVSFRDPEVGDVIQAMAIQPIGLGVRSEVLVPGADLLPTAQGVALVPLADGTRLEGNRSGIEVSMPGGLHLSRDIAPQAAEGTPGDGNASAAISQSGPADPVRWMRGGADKFVVEHQKLLTRQNQLKPEDRNTQRLEIARHYLANGMAAEALGVLRILAANDPAQVDSANFRGARGIAEFMMMRDAEAKEDLSHPSLSKDPQAQLWLAAVRARSENDPKQALLLRLAPEDLKGMNARLRMMLGGVAVQSVAKAGDGKAASKIVESMNGTGLSRRDVNAISYYQGIAAEANRAFDQAVAKYKEAEEGEDRPSRAYAGRARIELQLRRNTLSPSDAIRQLEKLRFAWREGDFEYLLLKRLGELMIADGQFAEGLRSMRSLITNYSDHPDIGNVQQAMSDAFEKLYLNGGADKLSPIAAIGLYDEFQELTPSGAKGDEMIRKLADRLAAVDLLDRAAELLRHQVQFRLTGVDKARIGARLAFLEMGDRKSAPALESLDMSEVPDQPADLYDQRRYMRVRALADLGRSAEALALIVNDQSDQAKLLRTEIFWGMKKWADAANALESTLEIPPGTRPLEAPVARKLVDLATAMTLARDDHGLARLRRTYGPRMTGTEFREAFELLTSEPERGIADYRRIADKIKQVEQFQTFMSEWKKRVQDQGLSSIN